MRKRNLLLFVFIPLMILIGTISIFNDNQIYIKNKNLNNWSLEEEKNLGYISNSLSGNAKWLIYNMNSDSITLTRLNFLVLKQVINYSAFGDISLAEYETFFPIWSPNNDSFLLIKSYRNCFSNEFLLFRNTMGWWYITNYHLDSNEVASEECFNYVWSSDSEKFAMAKRINVFDDKVFHPDSTYSINIFDNNANQIQTIDCYISQEDNSLFPNGMNISINWFNEVFFLTLNNSLRAPTKIISFSESNPSNSNEITLLEGAYQIFSANNDSSKLFLSNMDYHQKSEYQIIDVQTGEITKSGKIDQNVNAGIIYPKASIDLTYFGIIIDDSSNYGQAKMLIWDWDNEEFSEYNRINYLLGWDDKLNGFFVFRNSIDDFAQKQIDIIYPTK